MRSAFITVMNPPPPPPLWKLPRSAIEMKRSIQNGTTARTSK